MGESTPAEDLQKRFQLWLELRDKGGVKTWRALTPGLFVHGIRTGACVLSGTTRGATNPHSRRLQGALQYKWRGRVR